MDIQPILELLNQEWLLNQLNGNEFLIAGIVGALFYFLRGIPSKILYFIERNITIEFTLTNEDEIYDDLVSFIDKSRIKLLSRTYSKVSTDNYENDYLELNKNTKSKNSPVLSVGYGPSWIFYKNTFGYINRKFKEDNHSNRLKEEIFIQLFTRKKSVLVDLLAECNSQKDTSPEIFIMTDNYFEKACDLQKRDFNSIYIPHETKSTIIGLFDDFLRNYEKYQQRGLPYKLGIMLEGPPGTGKSSIVKAIASYLKRDLYFVSGSDLSRKGRNGLISELRRLSRDAILVLEELDTLSGAETRDNDENNGEISGLLNILDGILTPPGLIVIATTNHIDKIDHALLRKGRFDKIFHIDLLKYDLFVKMISELWGVSQQKVENILPENDFKPIEGARVYSAYAEFSDNLEKAMDLLKREFFQKDSKNGVDIPEKDVRL